MRRCNLIWVPYILSNVLEMLPNTRKELDKMSKFLSEGNLIRFGDIIWHFNNSSKIVT